MHIIYQITKDDLFDFLEVVSASKTNKSVPEQKTEELYLTSIKSIQKAFKCCPGTAQKIKNKIPKEKYWQEGRKFRIALSVITAEGTI